MSHCPGHERHWFAYRGEVGTSAPVCQRHGCGQPNPNYEPDRDPRR